MKLGKVLWKAIDGREFIIDTNALGISTVEALYVHIAELRKTHGYEEPDLLKNNMISHAHINNPELEEEFMKHKGTVDVKELPDDLQADMKKLSAKALSKPDPKKLD